MSILSFNIEGYRRNRNYLATLQKLWLAYEDQPILENDFPDYTFVQAATDMFEPSEDKIQSGRPIWQGAPIAWNNDLCPLATSLPVTCDRFAAAVLNFGDDQKILAISLYSRTSGRDDEFLACLSQTSFPQTYHSLAL